MFLFKASSILALFIFLRYYAYFIMYVIDTIFFWFSAARYCLDARNRLASVSGFSNEWSETRSIECNLFSGR